MISYLHGTLTAKEDPSLLIIDVHGIGYEVAVSAITFSQLPRLDETIHLLIHMIVREDAHLLFGFLQEVERQLFRVLIKVSGVGPKLALAILSSIEIAQFIHCVQHKNIQRLTSIPGVGKKTAERLIIETRDTLTSWVYLPSTTTQSLPLTFDSSYQQSLEDAMSALTALGYKSHEAKNALKQLSEHEHNHNTENLIRLALQKLMKGTKS